MIVAARRDAGAAPGAALGGRDAKRAACFLHGAAERPLARAAKYEVVAVARGKVWPAAAALRGACRRVAGATAEALKARLVAVARLGLRGV